MASLRIEADEDTPLVNLNKEAGEEYADMTELEFEHLTYGL